VAIPERRAETTFSLVGTIAYAGNLQEREFVRLAFQDVEFSLNMGLNDCQYNRTIQIEHVKLALKLKNPETQV